MSEPLSPAELAEIAKRAESATPGPWLVGEGGCVGPEFINADDKPCGLVDELFRPYTDLLADDSVFIAAARTDIPRLLATIAALTAENKAFQECSPTKRGRDDEKVTSLAPVLKPEEIEQIRRATAYKCYPQPEGYIVRRFIATLDAERAEHASADAASGEGA